MARGATLQALREHGWRLRGAQGELRAPARAADDAHRLGPQDVVIVAVKAQALPEVAERLAPLLAPHTQVVTAMNGVPWWFCAELPAWRGVPLRAVDPHGRLATLMPLGQVVHAVVHASTAQVAPGVIQHKMGQGLILGPAVAGGGGDVSALAALLSAVGFEASVASDIRRDIWYKLWGNMTTNPISAFTGATVDQLMGDPLVRELCSAAMREAALLGERLGCGVSQSPEDRHVITAKLGAFKTSMLQDVEAGRNLELDALLGVVHEMARHERLDTPFIDGLWGLARVFARQRGLYASPPGSP